MNFQWTLTVIFMASAVSGLLNYTGLTELAPAADWWLKSIFALTAIVVTFCLSLFWRYAFQIVPELSRGHFRMRGWAVIVVGLMAIISLSTYWNVAALTKGEPLTLNQPNILKGVLLHWDALIPPIATAIAIDVLPLVILLFTVLRYDDQGARGNPRNVWTAQELLDALQQIEQLQVQMTAENGLRDVPDFIDLEPVHREEIGDEEQNS